MASEVGNEIIYSFPNFIRCNRAAVEGWGWISIVILHLMIDVYLSTLESMLIDISKRGPGGITLSKSFSMDV